MAYIPRWGFDAKSGKCIQFIYGGCGGNANNFQTQEECENKCKGELSFLFTIALDRDSHCRRHEYFNNMALSSGTGSLNGSSYLKRRSLVFLETVKEKNYIDLTIETRPTLCFLIKGPVRDTAIAFEVLLFH